MSSIFDTFNGVTSPVADTREIDLSQVVDLGEHEPSSEELDTQFVFAYPDLRRFLGALRLEKNLWIWGPAGCGKTEMAIQVALRCRRPYALISFSEETSLRDLIGTWALKDGETFWRDGALAKACQTPGCIVILDELNMAPAGIVAALNALLQQGEYHISETGGTVRVADGVMFVATANTSGSVDESGLYAGSQIQNGATRSRFSGMKVGYLDPDLERQIVLRKYPEIDAAFAGLDKPASEKMVELARLLRVLVDEGKVSLPFSVRQILSWTQGSLEFGSLSVGFQFAYADLLGMGELPSVAEAFFKVFGVKLEG